MAHSTLPTRGLAKALAKPGSGRVQMAGAGHHMRPAFAIHTTKTVKFRAYLKIGEGETLVEITGPKLTRTEASRWIHERWSAFQRNPSARESPEESIRRKVIAAQGTPFVRRIREYLSHGQQGELDMMLSPQSHSQGADVTGIAQQTIFVTRDGTVTGLSAPTLLDTDRTTYKA